MKREERNERERLLELQADHTRWFSQEEFDRLRELSNKMFAEQSLPPAEGAENVAEEVFEKAEAFLQSKDIWNHPYISDRENKSGYEVTFLIAEFATLHAQKMAEENLREELINWADYWNRIETGHACIMKEDIDEYLKSKEQ